MKVLTALLRAGPCNGRALENEEDVATACIAVGFTSVEVLRALKHLLEPLKHEDGPKPKKAAKAKIWNERRVVARRVADLLHDMGIHMKNVTFASYDAVQTAWRVKEDDRKREAEKAQFNADMDAVDEEEEEPKAKRPKRSCRTKTRRCGST